MNTPSPYRRTPLFVNSADLGPVALQCLQYAITVNMTCKGQSNRGKHTLPKHTHTHTHTHTLSLSYTHTHIQTRTLSLSFSGTHTHTHTLTLSNAHTHTHTHT